MSEVDVNGFEAREGRMSNVSLLLRPDGNFEIVARCGAIMTGTKGIPEPDKLQGRSIYPSIAGLPRLNLEDPVIWYSGGMYPNVVNCWSARNAFHLTSPVGIRNGTDWKLADGPMWLTSPSLSSMCPKIRRRGAIRVAAKLSLFHLTEPR